MFGAMVRRLGGLEDGGSGGREGLAGGSGSGRALPCKVLAQGVRALFAGGMPLKVLEQRSDRIMAELERT